LKALIKKGDLVDGPALAAFGLYWALG